MYVSTYDIIMYTDAPWKHLFLRICLCVCIIHPHMHASMHMFFTRYQSLFESLFQVKYQMQMQTCISRQVSFFEPLYTFAGQNLRKCTCSIKCYIKTPILVMECMHACASRSGICVLSFEKNNSCGFSKDSPKTCCEEATCPRGLLENKKDIPCLEE